MENNRVTKWALETGIVIALVIAASAVAHNYLSDSLFAWGDHPGQFMRFWYPLKHAMAESGHWLWGVISWNPTWYAGYPEIQFYPPGMTLLGITLHYLTLGLLSSEQVYNIIPAIAFTLPLFSCYVFLRYALAPVGRIPSMLAGVSAGFLAISLKPMWGGIDGVMIGLMGERLAFGFAPLVLLAGWWFVERPAPARLAVAALLLGALLLLHPFHAPALVIAVALYAAARIQWKGLVGNPPLWGRISSPLLWIILWVLLAVGLVAWWVLPLLTHYTPYAAALVRASSDQVISWFDAGRIEWLWLAGLMALMLMPQRHPRVEGTVGVFALLAPFLVGGILFNDRVLLARLGITVLDPIRFIAEYYLALILLVGCAVGAITSRFLWRIPWLATICSLVVIVTMRPYLTLAWSDLQSAINVAPTSRLSAILQHPAYQGFWDALSNDPTRGRIFFVSNYLQLPDEEGVVTPTTSNSLTPYLTGREIVGGTFSHWSPIARWLWLGDPHADLLPAQMESGDNRRVFGKAWDEITGAEIASNLTRLNVTTVVVEAQDANAVAKFDASPVFAHYWRNDFYVLYHVVTNPGEWFEARGARVDLVERSARRWVFHVKESSPNATLLLKMSHFPLWQAHVGDQSVPLTATPDALQSVTLPEGAPYTLTVTYREGSAEWAGLAITLASLLLVAYLLLRRADRDQLPDTPD
jgi:hypothetical protein